MSDKIFANLARIIERQDDVLLGRSTYDYWASYWPTADIEPFATFINTTIKHVATSSELSEPWENTVVIEGQPVSEYVRQLKQTDGGDIGVHGSMTLARTLLAADLVDKIHLVIAPTLAGTGDRLFADGSHKRRVTLESIDHDLNGNLLVAYRRGTT